MAISLANNFCAFVASSSNCSFSPFSAGSLESRRRWCRRWHLARNTRNLGVRAEAPSEGRGSSSSVAVTADERSEADKLVDGMSFGELCDEFQCISSPAVEATARQLARDILELREGNRALATFAISVKYKDPLRSFSGRDKYKRPSWIAGALEKPSAAVRQMVMLSTSELNIKWVLRGKPKIPGPDLVLAINDTFTLNQISGQVVEHVQEWDLSGSSPIAQAYFWASRLAYLSVEGSKDATEVVQGVSKLLKKDKDGDKETYFRDPTDPTKFFQTNENPQRDLYQIGLFIALIYLLVQFLKATL
ncbi:hypothetical protein L7F22_036016 [Adiantum nelumboides]|nr:hypothetical protein [Adiantum nelumboides]